MMRCEHPEYGDYVLLELTQGMVEDFANRLKTYTQETPAQVYRRAVVECAIKAGWFESAPADDLKVWKPAKISWLAEKINGYFLEVITPVAEKK